MITIISSYFISDYGVAWGEIAILIMMMMMMMIMIMIVMMMIILMMMMIMMIIMMMMIMVIITVFQGYSCISTTPSHHCSRVRAPYLDERYALYLWEPWVLSSSHYETLIKHHICLST